MSTLLIPQLKYPAIAIYTCVSRGYISSDFTVELEIVGGRSSAGNLASCSSLLTVKNYLLAAIAPQAPLGTVVWEHSNTYSRRKPHHHES